MDTNAVSVVCMHACALYVWMSWFFHVTQSLGTLMCAQDAADTFGLTLNTDV